MSQLLTLSTTQQLPTAMEVDNGQSVQDGLVSTRVMFHSMIVGRGISVGKLRWAVGRRGMGKGGKPQMASGTLWACQLTLPHICLFHGASLSRDPFFCKRKKIVEMLHVFATPAPQVLILSSQFFQHRPQGVFLKTAASSLLDDILRAAFDVASKL